MCGRPTGPRWIDLLVLNFYCLSVIYRVLHATKWIKSTAAGDSQLMSWTSLYLDRTLYLRQCMFAFCLTWGSALGLSCICHISGVTRNKMDKVDSGGRFSAYVMNFFISGRNTKSKRISIQYSLEF